MTMLIERAAIEADLAGVEVDVEPERGAVRGQEIRSVAPVTTGGDGRAEGDEESGGTRHPRAVRMAEGFPPSIRTGCRLHRPRAAAEGSGTPAQGERQGVARAEPVRTPSA